MTSISLLSTSKAFGKVKAVDNVSLEIKDSEFFLLLGPSGCGKSTILRLIAGLDFSDSGKILFDSEDYTCVTPFERNVGFVFQQYALWPHLSVYEHLSFALKSLGLSKKDSEDRITNILDRVELQQYRDRYPHELSGGQQQRVAVARALVRNPKVLLFDEPLSNLDPRLRESLREEIKDLQRSLKITVIYVCHDPEEAISLADRIAIMKDGSIIQVGSTEELLINPSDPFISSFLGLSITPATYKSINNKGLLNIDPNGLIESSGPSGEIRDNSSGYIAYRPSQLRFFLK